MSQDYYLFIILALFSEIVGTVSGFGSSILFVPVASLFFPFKTVLGITAVFHVFSNLSKIVFFREGVNKSIAIKLGIPAIIFVIVGAFLTTKIEVNNLQLILDILLPCVAFYLLINFNKNLKQSNKNLYTGGAISGLLAGLTGTGGAIRGITLTAFNLTKNIFIATSALIDLGVDTSRSFIYVSNGYFEKKYVILIPFLIGVSIVGSYTGKLILKHTSEKLFRYIVLVVIILTSFFQLIKYFNNGSS